MSAGAARAIGRRPPVLRLLVGAGVLGLLYLIAREAGDTLPRFASWVDGLGYWGPLVFVAGYALAVVAMVPGAILTLAGGAIFGLLEGTLYVFAAAFLIKLAETTDPVLSARFATCAASYVCEKEGVLGIPSLEMVERRYHLYNQRTQWPVALD